MAKIQKLELTWVGKNEPLNLEPRILIEDKEKSYGDENAENMIIHGDNLLALKALEQKYSGQVKCIYIDPPYNTGNAFEHYNDNVEHSVWLNLMRERLEILHNLLSNDGFLACHIDDSEGHYLKVLLDEIFGRSNYQTTFYVRVRYPEKTLKQDMNYHKEIEQIHIYRKSEVAIPKFDIVTVGYDKFCYYIKDSDNYKTITLGGKRVDIFEPNNYAIVKKEGSKYGLKEIWASGTILDGNSSGRFFRDYLTGRSESDGLGILYKVWSIGDDRFDYRYFTGPQRKTATKGKYYQGVPTHKLDDDEITKKVAINNFYDLAGNFGNCRQEGGVEFRGGKKPETLLELILNHFSNEGDLVLDSFLGSGTTCAVAHKMNRKYIGIELGEHCYSHCLPRLKRIVDGEDTSGVSKSVNWKSGGGFKFYELAPSLLKKDIFDNWVIDEIYNSEMLAEAMAIHEGFKYSPDNEKYFKQGKSSENSYIYTTTNYITVEYLNSLHSELNENESLVICCKNFDTECTDKFDNIIIKKIPKNVLNKCEFGNKNYNLNIVEENEEYEEDE